MSTRQRSSKSAGNQRSFVSYKVARRSFLRTAAGAGLFLPLLSRIEARAQTGAPPPARFLVVQRAVGTVFEVAGGVATHWSPDGTPSQTNAPNGLALNVGRGTAPAAEVGGVTAAFQPLIDKTTIIDGLDIITAGPALVGGGASNNGGFQTHEGGMVAIMTGAPSSRRVGQQDHRASGPSIDQILLAQSPLLGRVGAQTLFGSLQLGTDARSDRNELGPRVMSYLPPPPGAQPTVSADTMTEVLGPDAIPLPAELNPLAVYQRLFGGALSGDAQANAATVARLVMERSTLIDYLQDDLAQLGTLVPASQRSLVDAHVTALQNLGVTFSQRIGVDPGSLQCTILPDPSAEFAGWDPNVSANATGANAFHEQIGLLQLALVRTAFACDLARVATFTWSPGTNQVIFGGLYAGMLEQQHHAASHANTPEKDHDLIAIERWYADRTAQALLEFDQVIEADGTTLLDNTIVPYITEVARGFDHNHVNAPWAVIGGSNLGVPGGRYYRADGPNRPTNDLWAALAPAFQVELPNLGAAEQSTGPLPDFLV